MHGTQQKCLVALFAPAILKQLRLVSRRSFPFAPTVNCAVGAKCGLPHLKQRK